MNPSVDASADVAALESNAAATVEVTAPSTVPQVAEKSAIGAHSNWNIRKFFASTATGQASLETFTVGGPALIDQIFGQGHAQSILPDLSMIGYFMMLLGRLTGPAWVNRFGSRRAYIGLLVVALIVAAVETGLVWTAILTFPMIMCTMGSYRYAGSASTIAENGIINSLSPEDQSELSRTTAKVGFLTQTIAALVPFFSGYIITWKQSVVPLLVLSLVFYLISIALLLWFKSPETPPNEAARASLGEFFRDLRASLANGWRLVWHSPVLRNTTIVMSLLMTLNPVIYAVFAPNYADLLIRTGLAQAKEKPNLYTMIFTGMALGGILAYLYMAGERRDLKDSGESLARRNELARRNMLRWVLAAIVGTSLLASLAIPAPMLGSVVPLPGPLVLFKYFTLPAMTLGAFTFLLVMASNKLRAFFNARSSSDSKEKNDAYGIYQAAFMLSSVIALGMFKFPFTGELPFGFKPVAGFKGLEGALPFKITTSLVAVMALGALISCWSIQRHSRPAVEVD